MYKPYTWNGWIAIYAYQRFMKTLCAAAGDDYPSVSRIRIAKQTPVTGSKRRKGAGNLRSFFLLNTNQLTKLTWAVTKILCLTKEGIFDYCWNYYHWHFLHTRPNPTLAPLPGRPAQPSPKGHLRNKSRVHGYILQYIYPGHLNYICSKVKGNN